MQRDLTILPETFAIARLEADAALPDWLDWSDKLIAVVRTREEWSIVCAAARGPDTVKAEFGWRAFKLEGPIPLAARNFLVGAPLPIR